MRKRYVVVFQFTEQGTTSLECLLHCLEEEGYRLQTITPPGPAASGGSVWLMILKRLRLRAWWHGLGRLWRRATGRQAVPTGPLD